MARRKSKARKTRTRTITKTRRVFTGIRSRSRSFAHRHKGKADHWSLLAGGAGAGAITTTVLQIARKNGVKIPTWVDLLASGITGFLTGKHIGKTNAKAVESALASVGTSFIENKAMSGQPILNLNLSNGSSQSIGGQVY